MTESSNQPEEIPYRAELLRKSLHVLALIIPLGMHLLGRELALWILIPSALLAVSIEVARVRSKFVATWVEKFFGGMMRAEERPPIGAPVTLNGATWILISGSILTFFFPIHIAVRAFAMFILSDAAAALIGRKYGRRHFPGSEKTIEGSLAFVATSLVTLSLLGRLTFPEMVLASLAGALIEWLPLPVNDNVRVPVCVAILLVATQSWL